MTALTTLLDTMAKAAPFSGTNLKHYLQLCLAALKDDLENPRTIVSAWVEDNDPYLDFTFALKPEWLKATEDDLQVKLRFTVDTDGHTWYATAIVDCIDGELPEWGEKEFTRDELAAHELSTAHAILSELHGQYDRHKKEARADLNKAEAAARKIQKHLDEVARICKEAGVHLRVDRTIEAGVPLLYVVPDSMEQVDAGSDGSIPVDDLPHADPGASFVDSGYDAFAPKA
jgi:hypothetical protein